MLYVVGGADENEILLFSVVLALRDSLAILLKWVGLYNVLFWGFIARFLISSISPYVSALFLSPH